VPRLFLKGKVLTKAGAGRLTLAILLASFNIGTAFAQSQTVQSASKEPAQQQSTNQIVGATDQKSPEQPTTSKVSEPAVAKQQEPQIESFVDGAVVPPAPVIIKKTTNAIMIPALGTVSKTESTYETRPSSKSNVSVGSIFGYRRDPFTRRAKFHSGVDIKARWGDPVGASKSGIVTFAGWYHGYGNLIIVSHGGGVATHYAHLSSFDVEIGSRVQRGTIIGRAGSTGRATSPHLHYEVRLDGNALNPFQPITLEATSDYFKQQRPTVDAGRSDSTSLVAQPSNK
jgi:murein DD-endopeptidase MepM/ murein hydrolase activator NlpD